MKQPVMEKREDESGFPGQLVERVGAGRWNASIWKTGDEEESRIWFVMDGEAERRDGREYRADEIFTLVKLAQVLAATFVFEVNSDFRDENNEK